MPKFTMEIYDAEDNMITVSLTCGEQYAAEWMETICTHTDARYKLLSEEYDDE